MIKWLLVLVALAAVLIVAGQYISAVLGAIFGYLLHESIVRWSYYRELCRLHLSSDPRELRKRTQCRLAYYDANHRLIVYEAWSPMAQRRNLMNFIASNRHLFANTNACWIEYR